ncbi:MAG: peptidoglycan DD-metalloendopeptidase family protein [Muribaculaceae bacterium]|nr:peptidoglycan DD-metalloendopeptidase family protein [Muribaculaceae bacterium]
MKRYKRFLVFLTRWPRMLVVTLIAVCITSGYMTPSVSHAFATAQSSRKSSGKGGTKGNGSKSRQAGTSQKSASKKTSSAKSSSPKSSSSKKSSKKGTSKGNGKKRQNGGGSKNVSSAELQRRQENAQREIEKTREEIRLNDASIKKNLSELSKIESDISVSSKEVGKLKSQVSSLQKQIDALTGRINEQTARLEKLRAEYLKAVKKMRGNKRRNSQLAFVFSSANLSQAERRMRYLKEFSDWRQSQTVEINNTVAELKRENEKLAQSKKDYDVLLGRQMKVQERLVSQQAAQNRIVAELRANGTALNNHLSKKQAEVNELRNRVAALIAEEQRKAAEEQRRREIAEAEAQRKREEEHRLNEERRKAALAKADEAQKMSESKGDKGDKGEKGDKNKSKTPKEDRKQDKKNIAKQEKSKSGKESKDYASARRRKPRGESATAPTKSESVPSSKSTPTVASGGGFAAMKGQLPRPVSGSFRITSQFGRHALPDLPDVVYDNPGIDAEVSAGATATAVYAGKVSGVYMIPGFATVVIVNHGDYYTVYGNIASASVKVGDAVRQGDAVGKVATDPDNPGHSSIHFEVWKNRDKLNPASWIR